MVMRALVVLGALLVATPAWAQDARSAEARAHFDAGRGHARAERWAEALTEFRASDGLYPRAVTEFNIASALMRLGRAREVLAECDRITARSDVDEALRRDVVALRAAAEASLRTLVVEASPPGLTIEVDGAIVDGEGSRREIVLDPGAHALVARAPGHAELRTTVAPDQAALAVALEELPTALLVEASEPDATIWIDGVPRGLGRLEETLAAGTHHVRVERDGRLPFDTDVSLAPGEHAVVPAELVLVPSRPLTEDPVFWGITGAGAAVVIGVAIGLGVAFGTAPQPYGGTSGVVIAPILAF